VKTAGFLFLIGSEFFIKWNYYFYKIKTNTAMRKYYFTIASILVLAIGITSCSNEENKTQNQVAARPSVPILDTEVRIGNQIWMARNLKRESLSKR